MVLGFDAVGRLVERELPATAHAPAEVQRFAWRGTRLVEAATAAHTLAFEHDAAGRVIRETHTRHLPGTEPVERTTTHAYAILGTRATTRLPNGLELGQLTYGSGHVHQLRIADRVLAEIEHDALYRPTSLRLGGYDGLVQSLAFDALGALTMSRLATPGGAPLAEARYAYDALGRLLTREGTAPRRYAYDALDRLAGEVATLSGAHPTQAHHAEYRFDPAGNRLSVAAALSGVEAEDWAATVRANLDNPAFNLLGPRPGPAPGVEATRCPDNRLHTLDGSHYRYDAWGNLVERTDPDGSRTLLGYDAEHRLVSLARYHGDTLAHRASYSYDAFGRRRSKVLWLPTADGALSARQVTRYDWDDDRLVGEHLATLAPDANQWHATDKVFAYHPNTFTPLAQITCQPHANGKARIERIEWYHTDQIGTPLALVDAQGKETWRIELDAWGRRLDGAKPADGLYGFSGATDPNEQPIRLPGQYYDAESGMHYNRYRYYDPKAGRYVTQDPIGLAGGVNLYRYAVDPTSTIDPFGLEGVVVTKRCARLLGDRGQPPTTPSGSPLRHDYLVVGEDVFSFQAGNDNGDWRDMIWSRGWIDDDENIDNPECKVISTDSNFAQHVREAVVTIGERPYAVNAYVGTSQYLLGARNCQSWVKELLNKSCPTTG